MIEDIELIGIVFQDKRNYEIVKYFSRNRGSVLDCHNATSIPEPILYKRIKVLVRSGILIVQSRPLGKRTQRVNIYVSIIRSMNINIDFYNDIEESKLEIRDIIVENPVMKRSNRTRPAWKNNVGGRCRKLNKDNVLDDTTREAVYFYIKKHPGCRSRDIYYSVTSPKQQYPYINTLIKVGLVEKLSYGCYKAVE